MIIDTAVVPVAGLGTRLLPATKSQPKEMLPVGRKPVVQYVFEELTSVGVRRIVFITGSGKASIENHFDINEELVQALRESGKEDLLEKPRRDEAPSRLAIAARYVLSPAVFDVLERTRPGKAGEIQLTDAIRQMIHGGGRVYGVRLGADERRFDIGNFDSYFRAFVELALADPKHGASLREFLVRLVN